MIMTAIVTVIAAYLIGSVSFAVIFSRAFLKDDIRHFGSGNAGATNMLRIGGVLPGTLTFLCDLLKGTVASLMGSMIFSYIFEQTAAGWAAPVYGAYLCGVACMLGHVFPIFFGFKGGKGVAVGVGIYLVCSHWAILIGLAVFVIVLLISKFVSLSSLIATATVVILSFIFHDASAQFIPQAVLSLAMGTVIFIRHSENVKRLLNGEESKISFGRNHNG